MKMLALLNVAILLTTTSGAGGACCRTVQMGLIEAVKEADFSQKISKPGTLEALRSPANTAGFQQLPMQDAQGRTRTVQVRYTAGLPVGQTSDTRTGLCVAGSTESELFANVTTNYYKEIKLTLDDGEFQTFCATQPEFRNEITRKKLNALYSAINTDIVTEIAANFGNWYDENNNTVKQVPLINTDGSAQYWGEQAIFNEFEDLEAVGRPILVGSGLLRSYTRLQGIGCCNDGGQDLSRVADFDFYRDNEVDKQIAGANHIIGLVPGATQFVSTNRYVGQYEKFEGNNAKTTVIDPATGLQLDMTVYYDWCETDADRSKWVITWSLSYGVFFLPDDLAPAGSDWEGVNGVLHFQATCGDANVCDNQS